MMSVPVSAPTTISSSCRFVGFRVICSDSERRRGFGAKNDTKNNKNDKITTLRKERSMGFQQRRSTTKQSSVLPNQAPGLNSHFDGKSNSNSLDIEFEERLEAIRRSAIEQKKADEIKEFGQINYDAPAESEKKTIGLGTKIGLGVGVLVFGLVFALGDFLPSRIDGPIEESSVVGKKLSEEDKATLQTRLKQYESTLGVSPKDPVALEGAAVTFAELGEYSRAASLLQDLAKEKPSDPDVFRLLGEVKYELKDYEGSATAYRSSAMVNKNTNFEVLRGLTNALLAAKKPDEAVKVLLASRDRLKSERSMETESLKVDPVLVDLLLGKVYSDWGHVSDAVSVYDQLISAYPDDFRGYLAKGIVLKENGNIGDAERMFIQARFFAPEKAKPIVDRYAKN